MKYLFILGRNIELSLAEIKAFCKKSNIEFKQLGLINNGLLIETKENFPKNIIDKLGGTVSIGEVLAQGTGKEISNELDKRTIYFGTNNKLNYIVFNFNGVDIEDISFYLKQKFKKESLKATEKRLTGNIKLQEGVFVLNVASRNIDEQYFVFENNFGIIIEKSNYEKIEERDMKKPVRRNELSISPRLAKILINLSEVKENETLLDPFCGIGVILEEALIQGIKVVGIDKDRGAIENAKKNLKWFEFDSENYKLLKEDSAKIKISKVEGIVTEPELGELQKGMPTKEKAMEIARNFERMMIGVLKNLKANVQGNIVFTAPLIFTGKERVSCSFKDLALKAGLRIILEPINEFRSDSIIGRSVVVMRK